MLVYLLQMDPHVAVTASLLIVGLNSLMGSILHWRAGHVKLKEAILFGLYGVVASYIGARASTLLSNTLLLVLFALLMLVIAAIMIRPKTGLTRQAARRPWWLI